MGTTAVLLPRATAEATKTPVATAMVGAQTAIDNQLNASMAIVTETAMMTATMTRMSGVGGGIGSLVVARQWRWLQHGIGGGGSAALAVAAVQRWQRQRNGSTVAETAAARRWWW
jgi:hypothetical protein